MNILEALRARKSIRAFKPDPVPKEFIREILGVAACSPSPFHSSLEHRFPGNGLSIQPETKINFFSR